MGAEADGVGRLDRDGRVGGRESEKSGKKWRQEVLQITGFLCLFPHKISQKEIVFPGVEVGKPSS